MKERIRIYREHIRQPQYMQLSFEEHLHTCRDKMFNRFPFLQENK